MMRGMIVLMLLQVISNRLHLDLLKFVLEKSVLAAPPMAMAVIFQAEFRRFWNY